MDFRQIAQESVFAVQLGATWARDLPVHRAGLVDVTLQKNTRVALRLDPGGLIVHTAPALRVKLAGPLPDVAFETASYDFTRARFDVRADAGLAGPVLEAIVESYLNGTLRKRLPAPLLRAGYTPQGDADLAGTVRGVAALLALGGDRGGASSPGLPKELDDARALGLDMTLEARRDIEVPAPGLDDLVVRIPKKARLSVAVRTTGRATDPVLDDIVVSAAGRGVIIASTGSGLLSALESIEVKRMTIRPGPALSFEYELLIEQLLNAPAVMLQLAQLLAGRYSPDAQGDLVLAALRPNIDLMLEEAVGGLLRDLLSEYDRVLPGLSLRAVFGA